MLGILQLLCDQGAENPLDFLTQHIGNLPMVGVACIHI